MKKLSYVSHTKNDRHFHLVGIGKDKRVIRAMPAWIQTKWIDVTIRLAVYDATLSDRECPPRTKQMECLGEYVVVNKSGVDGKQAHEKNNISSAIILPSVKPLQGKKKTTDKKNVPEISSISARANLRSLKIIYNADKKMIEPCPMSPNMTANKNGKVMTAKRPGLTSWYVAMP
jgi:hypothetical protein